jgi:hypothetical protein
LSKELNKKDPRRIKGILIARKSKRMLLRRPGKPVRSKSIISSSESPVTDGSLTATGGITIQQRKFARDGYKD